ncbi:MAG: GTP-binding protein [Acetatifactor sp.]|nr:GTP-binding protein [Acetatifactor sp.]
MTKIDVFSGFLGAGKTTLIKKLLKEALDGSKTVLIENEFGEIGIDGGFLKEAGIEIKEMNSGCICCSLVGDFGTSLREVITTYAPERILIEPSGVGKLSDVLKAVEGVAGELDVQVNSAVAVVDASKAKMYSKNFGEFFINQIEYAGTIILSRTDKASDAKIAECVAMIREHNSKATIITTPLDQLDGKAVLETIEGADSLEEMMAEMLEHAHEHEHHHHHEDGEECHCHDHEHEHEHHHHHEDDEECHCHDHEHEHEHHHHHEDDEECCCHDHEHEHEHHHHHEDGEECCCHEHEHEHHHHHHADEVFTSWGKETPAKYTVEKITKILEALDSGEYGFVLRAKGMVPGEDGTWIYYDYVPEESDIRTGSPIVTGKICVIGSKLDEDKLEELFQ